MNQTNLTNNSSNINQNNFLNNNFNINQSNMMNNNFNINQNNMMNNNFNINQHNKINNNFNMYQNNIIIENQKLKNECDIYKKENEILKNDINKLKDENNRLNNELIKANKAISNSNFNLQHNPAIYNVINNLNEMIKMKDNIINDLKYKLQNNSGNINKYINIDKIMVVNFYSLDQKINCGIKCLENETFAELEEKLYQQDGYEEYRNTNNNFIVKGQIVLRFKTLKDNNIKNGDRIQLLNLEN